MFPDPLAQNVMGMAYKYGIGTNQNHAMSLEWFRKAADQGDADAQFNLGRIYGKATGSYAKMRAAPPVQPITRRRCWFSMRAPPVFELDDNA